MRFLGEKLLFAFNVFVVDLLTHRQCALSLDVQQVLELWKWFSTEHHSEM